VTFSSFSLFKKIFFYRRTLTVEISVRWKIDRCKFFFFFFIIFIIIGKGADVSSHTF